MAIKANMTISGGISLTNAYCYIPTAYVKKFDGEWTKLPEEKDDEGNVTKEEVWSQGEASWKLIYDVLIYADSNKRADREEQNYRIKNDHIDHFKCDYDLNSNQNPFELAYEDLKANENLSNVKDV